jgi:hypothetical protein
MSQLLWYLPSVRAWSSGGLLLLGALAGATSAPSLAFADGSSGALVLTPGHVVELSAAGTTLTPPADGRLRGPDFTALVTGVAWPTFAGRAPTRYEAGPGNRIVVFSLEITQPADVIGTPGPTPTTASATLKYGYDEDPVGLSSIDDQIEAATAGSGPQSGNAIYAASVPAGKHDVDLVISEASLSQELSLWTLRRTSAAPSVLYRDQASSQVGETDTPTGTITITNPADGITALSDEQLTNATLNAFPPASYSGPQPNSPAATYADAYLDIQAQSLVSSPPPQNSFQNMQPLPGSDLSLSAPGLGPLTATAVSPVAPADQNTSYGEDGLLDATYVFLVPGDLTAGTITVSAATTTGTEFEYYSGSGNSVPLDVSGTTTFAITFPAVPPAAVQKTPPWVGAPLPATASVSSASVSTASNNGPLNIVLALVALVVVAAGALFVEPWFRRRRVALAAGPETEPIEIPEYRQSEGPERTESSLSLISPAPAAPSWTKKSPPAPFPLEDVPVELGAEGVLVGRALGPPEVSGWKEQPNRSITETLCLFLAFHTERPLSTDELLVALWPLEADREATRKTLQNYISRLRQCVGVEHFPQAPDVGGYLLTQVTTHWGCFRELSSDAEGAIGDEANHIRARALTLVRGQPFEGVSGPQFNWVFAESLVSDMTAAVVDCAQRLSADLQVAGDLLSAQAAARLGLRAAPKEQVL